MHAGAQQPPGREPAEQAEAETAALEPVAGVAELSILVVAAEERAAQLSEGSRQEPMPLVPQVSSQLEQVAERDALVGSLPVPLVVY